MNIPPINSSNWKSHVSATSHVDTGAGGGSGGYVGGSTRREPGDEVSFDSAENADEMDLLEKKSLLTIIKEFFVSLWLNIQQILGIKPKE